MSNQESRYCINCKHYFIKNDEAVCGHPKLTGINLVSGKTTFNRCEDMRLCIYRSAVLPTCGPGGELFEAK